MNSASIGPSALVGNNSNYPFSNGNTSANSDNNNVGKSNPQEVNAFTIAGYVKTIQPRKCSCSSTVFLKDNRVNSAKSSTFWNIFNHTNKIYKII